MFEIGRIKNTAQYTIPEVAEIMGVSSDTVYRLIKRFAIKASYRRSNGRMFVTGEELLKYSKSKY